jgi:phosphodiesterase/alkaline phosphatase D-like protein
LGFGAVADDGFVYRARADQSATIALEYSTNSDLSSSTTTTGVSVVSDDDYTGGEAVTGLSADTVYYCCPQVNGVRVMTAPFPQVKTFPTEGSEDAIIVFGSCMNSPVESSIFASMRNEAPDVFIHLGDFHYANTTVLASLRSSYQAMYQDDYYAEIVRYLATAHTWDDHEYGGNNEDGQLIDKENALQAHIEYRPLYDLESPSDGVYHSFPIANADVFMLDLRYNRRGGSGSRWPDTHLAVVTPDAASSGSTLVMAGNGQRQFTGAFDGWYYKNSNGVVERVESSVWDGGTSKHTCTLSRSVSSVDTLQFHLRNKSMMDDGVVGQLDWLVDGINASTKRWKVIVSSVVFNPTYVNSDSWGDFDFDDMESVYLRQHITADNVLVLSGDRHRSAIDDGTSSHWPECSASPLVQSQATMGGTWSEGMTSVDAHYYGLLVLSATEAVFTIRNADGTTNGQVTPLTVEAV